MSKWQLNTDKTYDKNGNPLSTIIAVSNERDALMNPSNNCEQIDISATNNLLTQEGYIKGIVLTVDAKSLHKYNALSLETVDRMKKLEDFVNRSNTDETVSCELKKNPSQHILNAIHSQLSFYFPAKSLKNQETQVILKHVSKLLKNELGIPSDFDRKIRLSMSEILGEGQQKYKSTEEALYKKDKSSIYEVSSNKISFESMDLNNRVYTEFVRYTKDSSVLKVRISNIFGDAFKEVIQDLDEIGNKFTTNNDDEDVYHRTSANASQAGSSIKAEFYFPEDIASNIVLKKEYGNILEELRKKLNLPDDFKNTISEALDIDNSFSKKRGADEISVFLQSHAP